MSMRRMILYADTLSLFTIYTKCDTWDYLMANGRKIGYIPHTSRLSAGQNRGHASSYFKLMGYFQHVV